MMTPDAAVPPPSLAERQAEQTRQWLVEAAVDLMTDDPDAPLVNAAIAQRAGVSERTVYRYFPTREALLDAVVAVVVRRLATPPAPAALEDLPTYPQALFACFEAQPQLTRAALKPEVFVRMRDGQAAQRWAGIQALVDAAYPRVAEDERRLATANIRYLLAASTWRYYRDNFGFSAADTVRSVQTAIRHTLAGLSQAVKSRR